MFVYRTLRKVALGLRSVQTALLGASFLVSDYAANAGERAVQAAHESLDKYIETGYAKANCLADAAEALAAKREGQVLRGCFIHPEGDGPSRGFARILCLNDLSHSDSPVVLPAKLIAVRGEPVEPPCLATTSLRQAQAERSFVLVPVKRG